MIRAPGSLELSSTTALSQSTISRGCSLRWHLCAIAEALANVAELGQSRRFRDVGDESGSPLRADLIGSIG